MSLNYQSEAVIGYKYCITGILGKGGIAVTYSAIDLQTDIPVAIKVISLKQLNDWKQIELFEREAEVLKQLNHPAIPKYLDYFTIDTETDKTFHLVQEIAPGKSLFELVESGWRTNESEVKQIAQQILEILSYLHSLEPPIIHRDLKPNNLILSDEGKIYLVDFGAVQNTYYNTLMQGSTVVGTYGYMAPEQFRGKALPATDLYSLGATVLYLLTHRSPADLPQDTLKLDFRSSVDISESFADWLEKILEPDIDDRFSHADIALKELFDSKQKKQQKLVKSFSAIALAIAVFWGVTAHKWLFLSFLGFYPDTICAAESDAEFWQQGGSLNSLPTKRQLSILSCIIKSKDADLTTEVILKTKNIRQIVNKLNSKNRTLLHEAALHEKNEVIELLLDLGADINKVNSSKETPLLFISDFNKIDTAKLLIDNGADVNVINARKDTPLLKAIRSNQLIMAKLLIEQGADVNAKNSNGQTALFSRYNSLEVVELLIEHGADAKAIDKSFSTPLFSLDNPQVAKLLIDNGADANATNAYSNNALFGVANREVLDILVQRGADLKQVNNNGKTALFYVQDPEVARQLINLGADIKAIDKHGENCLFTITNKDVVRLYIEAGVDVNMTNISGETTLLKSINRAGLYGNQNLIEIIKSLIEAGADVNAQNKYGQTPLSIAVAKRNKQLVNLLLENGADRTYLT
ncbi:MAG: ankyrin repeat domain-containing protein, partial [Cyanobacteria bacterium P01_G01_bin.19]